MDKIKINLPSDVRYIIDKLYDNNFEAYVVGGCIRDSILGRDIHDWDINTSAKPNEIIEIFSNDNNITNIIETGLKHGTITLVLNKICYEITTFRLDGIYSDGRHPDNVIFINDLKEDLSRRDFTINAMAYNDNIGLIDYFDGLSDLKNQIIRCVGDADKRFDEDALRILRAIRFSSQLEFGIDDNTLGAIKSKYKAIEHISIERINSEFCKIVQCEDFDLYLQYCYYIFELFIPELNEMHCKQNNPWHLYDVFNHTIRALDSCESNDLIIKLAVLFHDIGKKRCKTTDENFTDHFYNHPNVSCDMTYDILQRLRFDNITIENVCELVKYHDIRFEPSDRNVKKWLNKIGETQLRRLMIVRRADHLAQNLELSNDEIEKTYNIEKIIDKVLSEEQCFSLKDLAINGNDLIQIGINPGKKIGFILNQLLEEVIDNNIKNDKSLLINRTKEIINNLEVE